MSTLLKDDAVLLVVDIQGRLARSMFEKETLFQRAIQAIQGARALGLPVLCTEQYPKGLGPTVEEIAAHLGEVPRIPKTSFSCLGCPAFMDALRKTGRRQVVIAGIEAHICVYQTARDLLRDGYEVHLLSDAVSSRFSDNKAVGLNRSQTEGAVLSTVEMCLFELMGSAENKAFKEVVQIVK